MADFNTWSWRNKDTFTW